MKLFFLRQGNDKYKICQTRPINYLDEERQDREETHRQMPVLVMLQFGGTVMDFYYILPLFTVLLYILLWY